MAVPAVERPAAVMEATVAELAEEPDKEQRRENLQKQAQLSMQAEAAEAASTVTAALAALVAAALVDGLLTVQMQIPVLQERTIWAAVAVAAALAPQKAAPVLLAVPVSVSSAISEGKEANT